MESLKNIAVKKQVRLAFDPAYPITATVAGIERAEDDSVSAVILHSPQVAGGSIYFEADEITRPGIQLEILDPTPEDVGALLN
jgi:hypothetical protein